MVFRITTKVKDRIKLKTLDQIVFTEQPLFFEEWYINIFTANRKHYFIFTEGVTLFSYIISTKGINTFESFFMLIEKVVKDVLLSIAPDLKFEGILVKEKQLGKTENNYIRRIQLDQIYHAERYIENGVNTFNINQIPIACKGYQLPVEMFKNEIGKFLKAKGFVWVPD